MGSRNARGPLFFSCGERTTLLCVTFPYDYLHDTQVVFCLNVLAIAAIDDLNLVVELSCMQGFQQHFECYSSENQIML